MVYTVLLILIYYKHVSVAHMFQDAEKCRNVIHHNTPSQLNAFSMS